VLIRPRASNQAGLSVEAPATTAHSPPTLPSSHCLSQTHHCLPVQAYTTFAPHLPLHPSCMLATATENHGSLHGTPPSPAAHVAHSLTSPSHPAGELDLAHPPSPTAHTAPLTTPVITYTDALHRNYRWLRHCGLTI
jgi:hypothetical protein